MKEVQWKISIKKKKPDGQPDEYVDISEDLERVDVIQHTLDTPRLTEYQVNDVSFILMPNQYDYSPDKESNFFTTTASTLPNNKYPQTGYHVPVKIEGGFRGETLRELFSGIIVEFTHDVMSQGYRAVATDRSIVLRENTIRNFGIRKNNNLRPLAQQTTLRGEFQFSEAVAVVSEGSVVDATLGGQHLTEVQNFRTEGELSERNFQLTPDGSRINTETAPDSMDVLNTTYKAPLRGVSINRVVNELLDAYDITSPTAKLPVMESTTPIWSHVARPGYEIESATGTNRIPFGWNGYVTDMAHNPGQGPNREGRGDIYMLYTHRGSTVHPQLIHYDASADTWQTIRQAGSHAEWWQLATEDFNEFFILQTTGGYTRGVPNLGTFNPAEESAATSILKVNISAGSTSTFANSGSLRPQLAVHYWYGFISGTGKLRSNNPRFGFLPETRTGFHVAENAVWYRYASNARFGLARLRTSNGQGEAVIEINRDKFANEASFDFTLDVPNRTIYGSHTSIGESTGNLSSRHLVYRMTMPTSY